MEENKNLEKTIKEFVVKNNINLDAYGSALNGACVILSGFALHLRIPTAEDLISILKKEFPDIDSRDYNKELTRVFEYAKYHDYEIFWSTIQAKKEYKF